VFPVWATFAIVAAILIAGIAAAILVTRDSDDSTTARPTATAPPAAETSEAQSAPLADYLPPEVTNCQAKEPDPELLDLGEPVLEGVTCEPPDPPLGGGVSVAFYLYPDAASAARAYEKIVSVIGVEPGTSDCSTTGGEGPAETEWSGGGGQGRLLCRPSPGGGSALFWTSDGFPVLGGVLATNPVADVYVYWQMLSDYTVPAGTEAGTSAPLEQLSALLPPEVDDCMELPLGEFFQEQIAVLGCDSPDAGVIAGFHLFPSVEAATAAYQQVQQFQGSETDSGDCASGSLGEESWSGGGGQGRLICGYDSKGGEEFARLFWTSDGFPVLGEMIARSDDLTLDHVYAAWQRISDYPQ
jgi:hypothetical protein